MFFCHGFVVSVKFWISKTWWRRWWWWWCHSYSPNLHYPQMRYNVNVKQKCFQFIPEGGQRYVCWRHIMWQPFCSTWWLWHCMKYDVCYQWCPLLIADECCSWMSCQPRSPVSVKLCWKRVPRLATNTQDIRSEEISVQEWRLEVFTWQIFVIVLILTSNSVTQEAVNGWR